MKTLLRDPIEERRSFCSRGQALPQEAALSRHRKGGRILARWAQLCCSGSGSSVGCTVSAHSPLPPSSTPGGSEVKAAARNAGDPGSIPGSGRSPGEGNGRPLQYSCLENPMDGGAWQAAVHGVAKSRTRLSDFKTRQKELPWGFPPGSEVKASACNSGDLGSVPGFDPRVRKIPWRRKWQPTPVFLPGETHGRRSLVGYSPRGRKEQDTTERLQFQFKSCRKSCGEGWRDSSAKAQTLCQSSSSTRGTPGCSVRRGPSPRGALGAGETR